MFVAASNMVFAKPNVKNDKAKKETHDKAKVYKCKVDTIQTFVLDSMESKKNKEIANKLSGA
jgi:hypothetical protein